MREKILVMALETGDIKAPHTATTLQHTGKATLRQKHTDKLKGFFSD